MNIAIFDILALVTILILVPLSVYWIIRSFKPKERFKADDFIMLLREYDVCLKIQGTRWRMQTCNEFLEQISLALSTKNITQDEYDERYQKIHTIRDKIQKRLEELRGIELKHFFHSGI